MTSPRKYPPAEKHAAIARALDVGPAIAGRELGISSGTLSCWAHKARQGVPGYAPCPPTPEVGATQEPEPTTPSAGKVARVFTPSEKARALELADKVGITAASKQLGISRYSLYEWRQRVRLAAEGKGDSPTSGPDPVEIESRRDKEILDLWHTHPGLGPSQIKNQLRRQGVKVAVNTVRRVMEDAGYRPPKVKRDAHDERYEAVRPNHLWHLDFVHRHINRTNTFTLILIDDHSRFVVGHGVDDAERADMVVETFTEAVQRHGKPEAVMNDKGSAFWSWRGISRFTALLTELGVDQVVAENKEWNGKVEVFNGNLAKELFNVQRFSQIPDRRLRSAAAGRGRSPRGVVPALRADRGRCRARRVRFPACRGLGVVLGGCRSGFEARVFDGGRLAQR